MARTKADATKARDKATNELVRNLIGNKFINKLNCIEIIRKFSGIARARKMTAEDLWNAITFLMECQDELKDMHPRKSIESGDDDDANSESDDDDYVAAGPKKHKTKAKAKTKSTTKSHQAETAAIQCTIFAPTELPQDAYQTYDQTYAQEQLHKFVNDRVPSLGKRAARKLFKDPPSVRLKGSTYTNSISATDVGEPAITLAHKLVYADIRSEAVYCIWVSKTGQTITGVRPLDCIQFG